MNQYVYLGCLLLAIACQPAPENNETETGPSFAGLPAEFSHQVSDYLAEIDYNGTLLIGHRGAVMFEGAYGVRDVRDSSLLEVGTPFYLASVSKQITAMTLMMLAEQESLDLNDKLSTYFPELPFADSVTIHQMLTHTSGIPDYYDMGAFKVGMTNEDVRQALLAKPRLNFEPGSAYDYSNSAYVLLSMITEKASGLPYREFVQQNIFDPLEMRHSVVYDESRPEVPNRAIGFSIEGELLDYDAYTTGGGGIFSTVGDMHKWERSLYSDQLVGQQMMNQAYSPVTLSTGKKSFYGFGWRLVAGMPNRVFHTGSLAGFRTMILRDRNQEWMLIMLTNNENEELEAISTHLYDMCEVAGLFTD